MKPHPGSDPAIRQLLADLASGKPDYERMVPRFAEITRQQLPVLKTLKFVRAVPVFGDREVPGGGDDFDAEFEKDTIRVFLRLSFDGRIEASGLRKR